MTETEQVTAAHARTQAHLNTRTAQCLRALAAADQFRAQLDHLGAQISALASVLLSDFGGPDRDEGACQMAARLLREQRAELEQTRRELEHARAGRESALIERAQADELAAEQFRRVAELSGTLKFAQAEARELRAALELGQINCDAVYRELRESRDKWHARAQRINMEHQQLKTELFNARVNVRNWEAFGKTQREALESAAFSARVWSGRCRSSNATKQKLRQQLKAGAADSARLDKLQYLGRKQTKITVTHNPSAGPRGIRAAIDRLPSA